MTHEEAHKAALEAARTVNLCAPLEEGDCSYCAAGYDNSCRAENAQVITAYLAAMRERGFAMMPMEATDTMLDAARDDEDGTFDYANSWAMMWWAHTNGESK